jgi:hypothetical protein
MSANFTDGNWTLKWPIGKARISYPIPGDLTSYIISQDYMQLRSSYSAAALNTTHYAALGSASPTDGGATGNSSAYLIEIGEHRDMGQGVIMWTERYATKPAERSEYESYAYNFIGFYGAWGINTTTVTGRDRFSKTVMSRIAFKYYIPGVDGGITTAADIPLIAAQTYIYGTTTNNVDFLADSPPFTAATVPSRTTYEGWITGATEIVVEPSIVRRWFGNIWERQTRYVKAE